MKDSTVIIIIIVLGLMLFGGSLVAGFGTFVNDIMDSIGDWVKYGWSWANKTGTGYATLGLILHYEDGTTREVNNDNAQNGLYTLSISDDGAVVTKIEPYLRAYPKYEGSLTSWAVSSDLTCRAENGESITWHTETLTGGQSGEWTKEQEIWRTTIQMSKLDQALKSAGWTEGTVWTWLETSNTVTLQFTDGEKLSKTADASALIALDFDPQNAEFTSLNVALYASPMLEYGAGE